MAGARPIEVQNSGDRVRLRIRRNILESPLGDRQGYRTGPVRVSPDRKAWSDPAGSYFR